MPITAYLPDFTVHSIFEEHPERKITLRSLLAHTAGFTHEAPVGNNWDADAASFDAHLRSISDTWLRFPVGTGYAYSNLGIDLAAGILQKVTGQPFADYERAQLFQPLGMTHSSFDMALIGAEPNRAIGHADVARSTRPAVPMLGAGGMYASANDLAQFIQFALHDGAVNGQSVLSKMLLEEMSTVQFPQVGDRYGYGLGVARTGWYRGRNAVLLSHGGGGFGFISDLWWLPELKVGIAVLTNSSDHKLQGSLALDILYDLTHQPGPSYDRLMALPSRAPVTEGDSHWLPPADLEAGIAARALPADPARWQAYLGDYKAANWGIINPTGAPDRVYEQNGALFLDGSDVGDAAAPRLYETAPGLFFTQNGEALDFRPLAGGEPPTYRNLKLTRVGKGPSPAAWGLLAACGLVMLLALLALPARPIWRRLRQRGAGGAAAAAAAARPLPQAGGAPAAAAAIVGALGSLFGLASIGVVAAFPGLIYSGYLGWLGLPLWQKLLLDAPLGLAVCAAALAVLALPAWRRGWWSRGQRALYTALTLAALGEAALLAGWHLIGLG